VVEKPETVASAIRIGNPASWEQACAAIVESRGAVDIVSDKEILEAQRWLARNEGIFVEPASAAPIAGLFKCCASRSAAYLFETIPQGSRIVCTVTGNGLKDPDAVAAESDDLAPVAANTDAVRDAIGL
jgi:threonine synthase